MSKPAPDLAAIRERAELDGPNADRRHLLTLVDAAQQSFDSVSKILDEAYTGLIDVRDAFNVFRKIRAALAQLAARLPSISPEEHAEDAEREAMKRPAGTHEEAGA